METLEVLPFVGIGPIKLGMTKEECRSVLKSEPYNQPKHSINSIDIPESDYFFESSIQVTYNSSTGEIDWIGINDNIFFVTVYEGVDLFKTPLQEIVEHTKKYGLLDTEDNFLGYSFCFPKLGICYWRPAKTEDVAEGLDELDGEERDYFLEEIERSRYCQQVSIFKVG